MLKYRGPKSLCDIFLDSIITDLIRAIWVKGENLHGWQFKSGKRLCGGHFDKKFVLQYLSCYIYIQGNEKRKDERFVELRKLRTASFKAINYFKSRFSSDHVTTLGVQGLEYLSIHFLLSREYCSRVSANLQSIFRHYGKFVARNKKMFHTTGQCGDVRKIYWNVLCINCCNTNILHRIWYYELACHLANGFPFLLDNFVSKADETTNIFTPVISVTKRWLDSGKLLRVYEADNYPRGPPSQTIRRPMDARLAGQTGDRQRADWWGPTIERR